ncbi:LysE type translocator [Arenibacter algicola]|jgi:threonine/homoserine/homoserine lactone efflux protein|uniref:LysE type translocator n=2 Tax=Arenibacter TaxID=178469 RepID=A0A221USL5_9FLAO|nr:MULTISPECIES: LysE family transporter [Arenibacter]HCO85742.1 lysine transporter LysE [Arenibacter sp.]ASO04334.1 LysE type translocator [Arenibacter algicola]MDO6601251.1 LysE family transporter [Arenibacter palladensis]SHE66918.1 LysE type translocator [Arenibacter palladensis]GBF21409.1 lysE type translocator [Arenibacter sp. NBRC 103722]|tara:strand:+ start:5661 stop:6290 length:630 start_codon:yes stop_codon:yes gene_type:complete
MEHLLTLFFATFSAAFMATVPPGLLNMNAAKISVEKGKTNGIIFSLGVSTMIIIQAYISVLISKFLFKNPEIIDLLLKIALIVFAFFAIYFFVKAKKKKLNRPKIVKVSKKNSFFKGILLAALNLLTIPYYSGLNAMWNASGWIQFQFRDIATFILAAGCGTFTVLYLYTVYFTKLETKNNGFSKNSNYILSALMMLLLVITLIRIFYT